MMIALDLESIVLETVEAETTVVSTVDGAMGQVDNDIDFAFLDIDVRDGKTFGVAAYLSAHAIPFAFVSGSNPSRVPEALQEAPFIAKPYIPVTVTETLAAHIDEPRA